MRVALESPKISEVRSLIAELDPYQHSLYPPEACYTLAQPEVLFAVARDGDGQAVGCAAVVLTLSVFMEKRLDGPGQPEWR